MVTRRLSSQAEISLPLSDVYYDIKLTEADLAIGSSTTGQFPPPRFASRERRFKLFADLWRGDMSSLVEEQSSAKLPINYFRRIPQAMSDILLMNEPEAQGWELHEQAARGLRFMVQYGAAVVWAGESEGQRFVSLPEPRHYYALQQDDGEQGHVFVRPYVSTKAPTTMFDMAEVVIVRDNGQTTAVARNYDATGNLGGSVGESVSLGTSRVVIVPTAPSTDEGAWGTSWYEDMISPALEISRRFSENSHVLDKAGNPVLLWWMDEADAAARFPAPPTDNLHPRTPEDQQRAEDKAILEGILGLRAQDAMRMPSEAFKAEYLEFKGKLEAAFSQIEEAKKLLNFLTGVPSLIEMEQPPSGVALKRLMLPLNARTREMQNALAQGLSDAIEQEVRWEHIFDTFEDESTERQAQLLEQRLELRRARTDPSARTL